MCAVKFSDFISFELRLLNEVKRKHIALDNFVFYLKSLFEITSTTFNIKSIYQICCFK